MKISTYTKRALLGGTISLAIILTGTFLLGKLSGYEAKILIRNSLTGMKYLMQYNCFSIGHHSSFITYIIRN
ncbi:hypothetical protein [Flavobacterium sp.]|uniref:hypothetical protein n=1 Tax=Flavobacterium sp. TaxID=239 RepID=UPI002698E3EE